MANVIIKGKEYRGVPSIKLPQPGGGFAKFTEGGGATPVPEWNWMGKDAELVDGNIYSSTKALADTAYNGWTPSTVEKVIVDTTELTARTVDTGTYDYIIKWLFRADISYPSGTTMKSAPVRQAIVKVQSTLKRPANITALETPTFTRNACVIFKAAPILEYYASDGARSLAYTETYGFYISEVAATFSDNTSDAPNMTIKTPKICARCNATYFSTARGSNVDKANSTVYLKGELWRVKRSDAVEAIYAECVDLFNNPIT